jgi:predicted nuclease of predicted toxin-antitoxin system
LKILLDESVPHVVQTRLSHLAIRTVQDMGWAGTKNGELLRRAEAEFDVFVTVDQQLRYQQNLSGRTLAIIVLPTNQVRTVVSLLPAIQESLKRVQPGMFLKIPLPA